MFVCLAFAISLFPVISLVLEKKEEKMKTNVCAGDGSHHRDVSLKLLY